MNKYRAKKTEYSGQVYDSKGEAKLAQDIDILRKFEDIVNVERQCRFELKGANGGIVGHHRVDFLITFGDGHQEAWEYKGYTVRDFPIRKKLFEDNYPLIRYVVHKKQKPLIRLTRP